MHVWSQKLYLYVYYIIFNTFLILNRNVILAHLFENVYYVLFDLGVVLQLSIYIMIFNRMLYNIRLVVDIGLHIDTRYVIEENLT